VEQGSADWLQWRKEGIGSSDAPIILGVSPWKTPFQLWEEKTSDTVEEQTNWATVRGHELEPVARSHYELAHNIDMKPALKVHRKMKFLRASLDGYNEDASTVLEIKCVGKEDHALALSGKIPEKYIPQLAHQLAVTEAERVHYYSFDGTKGALVVYKRDEEFIDKLMNEECKFWEMVQSKTPPPLTDRDYVDIEEPGVLAQIALWKQKKKELESMTETVETLKRSIELLLPHPRCKGLGVRMQKIVRKGSVDYAKIPELNGVDLEKFRKPASQFFTFSIAKGD
jgi:putative phage-type endonuclease